MEIPSRLNETGEVKSVEYAFAPPPASTSSMINQEVTCELLPCSINTDAPEMLMNRIYASASVRELKFSLKGFPRESIPLLAKVIVSNKDIDTINDIDLFPLRQESEIYSVDLCDAALEPLDGALVAELVKLNNAVIEVKFQGESSFVVKDLIMSGQSGAVQFSGIHLDAPSCEFFTTMIPLGTHLRQLSLANCSIDDTCAIIIANAIDGLHVKAIDLASNEILHKGCLEILKATARVGVESLDLRGNQLLSTIEELESMVTEMKSAKRLETMNGRDIDLKKAIGHSRVIDFSGNGVDGGFLSLLLGSTDDFHGLERLVVSECRLEGFMEVFTSTLCSLLPNLSTLKQLSLPRNGLTDTFIVRLAAVLPLVQLEELDLTENRIAKSIVSLARAVAGCESLRSLDLSGNEATEARSKQFLMALDDADQLVEINRISLCGSKAPRKRAEFQKFDYLSVAAALSRRSQTAELILRKCQVNCARAAFVGKLLTRNTSLEKLDLSYNCLSTDGFEALSEGVASHSNLKELNLSNNRITDESMRTMPKLLTAPIEVLNLAGNEFRVGGMLELIRGIRNGHVLKCLDVSENRIEQEGFDTLCEALPLSRMQVLKARNIGISTGKSLGQTLGSCDHILHLDIAKNFLGSSCAHIVAALVLNSSITQLSLQENRIGDTIAALLAQALLKNTSLTKISLRGNRIKDKGAQALAKMLGRNSTLRGLDIASNYIGEIGGLYLAEALASSRGLRSVDVRCNNFSKVVIDKLSISWEANKKLEILRLYSFANASNEEDSSHGEGSQCSSTFAPTSGSSTTSSGLTHKTSVVSIEGTSEPFSAVKSVGSYRELPPDACPPKTRKTLSTRSVCSISSNTSTTRSNLRKLVSISRDSKGVFKKQGPSKASTLWRRRTLKERSKFDL